MEVLRAPAPDLQHSGYIMLTSKDEEIDEILGFGLQTPTTTCTSRSLGGC